MPLQSTLPGRQFRGGLYSRAERDQLFKQGTGGYTGSGFGPTSGAQMPQAGQPMGPAGNRMGGSMPWGQQPATAPQPAPATPTPFGGGFGGTMGINTSITPGNLFEPWMTQFGESQLKAQAAEDSNPAYLAKQYDRPGMSRSEGTMGLIAPQMASIRAGGDAAAGNLRLDDAFANARHRLSGEIARSGEAAGLGGLSLGMQELTDRFRNNQIGRMFGLFDLMG